MFCLVVWRNTGQIAWRRGVKFGTISQMKSGSFTGSVEVRPCPRSRASGCHDHGLYSMTHSPAINSSGYCFFFYSPRWQNSSTQSVVSHRAQQRRMRRWQPGIDFIISLPYFIDFLMQLRWMLIFCVNDFFGIYITLEKPLRRFWDPVSVKNRTAMPCNCNFVTCVVWQIHCCSKSRILFAIFSKRIDFDVHYLN